MSHLSSIMCERRVYTEVCYTHSHSHAQLLLPLQGTLCIETKYHHITLDHQHLFLLPPDHDHTFYSKDRNEFLVLDIPSPLFPFPVKEINNEVYQPLDKRWEALRTLFLNESRGGQGQNQGINELFRYAAKYLDQSAQPASLQYIHDHYHEKITLENLAALEHYNLTYYCEWFQKKTGLTPWAYIQRLRLERAKDLLLNTDMSLLHIAHEVGYEQQSSLTRLFQQQEKMSPAAYRRNYRK